MITTSETAGAAAGATSGTASETAVAANEMKWVTPSESGALKNGTAKQRETNKIMMEDRLNVFGYCSHDVCDLAISVYTLCNPLWCSVHWSNGEVDRCFVRPAGHEEGAGS